MEKIKFIIYSTNTGKAPFLDWLKDLDLFTRSIIRARLNRIILGNLGDIKPIKGSRGLYELRIPYGPGYRIYCGKKGQEIFILLVGGDKGSQTRDIIKAKNYWLTYKDLKWKKD